VRLAVRNRHRRSLCGKSPAQSEQWYCWIGRRRIISVLAGIIFTLVALFHLLRIFEDWPVMIVDWSAPKWMSWVGLIVTGGLAMFGFQFTANDED